MAGRRELLDLCVRTYTHLLCSSSFVGQKKIGASRRISIFFQLPPSDSWKEVVTLERNTTKPAALLLVASSAVVPDLFFSERVSIDINTLVSVHHNF